MRMIYNVFNMICWSLCVSSSSFANEIPDKSVVGAGALSCSFISEHPERYMPFVFTWAQGAMSAMNMYQDDNQAINLLPDNDAVSSQKAFIEDYCLKNPEREIFDAVKELYSKIHTFYPLVEERGD